MKMPLQLNLIAAACDNMGIGINNNLPWRLKKEMDYFNRMTSTTVITDRRNAVIMGHRTWKSIPSKFKPLKNRINIVLSRQLTEKPLGADHLANSLEDAVKLLESVPLKDEVESIWVIGGAGVYKDSIQSAHCHRIYLTRVLATFQCDTFFPDFSKDDFQLVRDHTVPDDVQEEDGIEYKFEIYERRIPSS